MKYITLLPRVFWKCWISLNFGIGLIILYPFFAFLLSKPSRYPKAFKLMRAWAHTIAFTSGIFYQVKDAAKNAETQPCVFCANHHSYLDILVPYLVIPHYFIFMGKREIQNVPLFNIFFKGMNILVDRKNNKDAHNAFVRAGEELDKGHSIFIFPEGGIKFRTTQLGPFKNGAFRLAIDKQVPIIPITFSTNIRLLQTGSFIMADAGPGISKITIHQAIPTKGLGEADLVSLRERCFNAIDSALIKKA